MQSEIQKGHPPKFHQLSCHKPLLMLPKHSFIPLSFLRYLCFSSSTSRPFALTILYILFYLFDNGKVVIGHQHLRSLTLILQVETSSAISSLHTEKSPLLAPFHQASNVKQFHFFFIKLVCLFVSLQKVRCIASVRTFKYLHSSIELKFTCFKSISTVF